MGRWGDGILQGDDDYDVAGDICADAGFNLWQYWTENDPNALGLEATRQKLNEGVFDTLFAKYQVEGHNGGDDDEDHHLVILVVLAMEVGATISKAQIAYTRSIYREGAGLMNGGRKQMRKALREYKNKPYDFEIKGLDETALEALSAAAEKKQADEGPPATGGENAGTSSASKETADASGGVDRNKSSEEQGVESTSTHESK